MAVSRLFDVNLRPADEITYYEIEAFWTQLKEKPWAPDCIAWLSPNGDLKAWTRGVEIVVLWNRYTGQSHQFKPEAL